MTAGPGGTNGMIHTEVFLSGATLNVELVGMGAAAAVEDEPVVMTTDAALSAPFDVLAGRFFNAQYGWLPGNLPGNQLQSLPQDRVIAVQLVGLGAENPGTLETYSGGNGSQLRPIDGGGNLLPTQHTMEPLFTAIGDLWLWDDFVMQHNWYAAQLPGRYSATYDVFVSDTQGVRDATYGIDSVTLRFTAVPEPAAAAALAFGGLMLRRRRKERA